MTTDPAWDVIAERFANEYRSAVVYADFEQETVLHVDTGTGSPD